MILAILVATLAALILLSDMVLWSLYRTGVL
jgi:hypothetical protein